MRCSFADMPNLGPGHGFLASDDSVIFLKSLHKGVLGIDPVTRQFQNPGTDGRRPLFGRWRPFDSAFDRMEHPVLEMFVSLITVEGFGPLRALRIALASALPIQRSIFVIQRFVPIVDGGLCAGAS